MFAPVSFSIRMWVRPVIPFSRLTLVACVLRVFSLSRPRNHTITEPSSTRAWHTATPLTDSRVFAYKIRGESKNNLW